MSAATAQSEGSVLPRLPLPGASPGEIRAALHPEYRTKFERDYRAALAEAARSMDLAGVHNTVEHWRRRSWITRDRHEHRRAVRRAVEPIGAYRPSTVHMSLSPHTSPALCTATAGCARCGGCRDVVMRLVPEDQRRVEGLMVQWAG